MLLLKNANLYAPAYMGMNDVLVGGGKILAIGENLDFNIKELEIYNLDGRILTPGLIDQHVHITGGGGEAGYHSRTPEIKLSDITKYGTTTLVGTLGTDGCTRSLENLYSKAKALEYEGISTFIHTGSYATPSVTFTDSITKDLVLIDKVIGVKIAMSDNRSSYPTDEEIIKILAQIRIGGMISKKGGILHIHMGGLETKLDFIFRILKDFSFPINYFSPTHCARTKELFDECLKFQKLGGFIDITTGGSKFAPLDEVIAYGIENGLKLDMISMSSDGNGSVPKFDENGNLVGYGCASCESNLKTLQTIVKNKILDIEKAISLMTKNVASFLNLHHKGEIKVGNDADFASFDNELNLYDVIARGEFCIKDGRICKKGFFE
ncbi:isoaspartyl dipeptidase [Campylobacter blaseri]|uniref:Isoaspartyl dipeptidase n=1 Tax=Campylobacter blaseri TaxID=2042961 RepID=A0A2P8R0N8_9BACT|nr:beta-aspartyl-peptidase [Campylobacter blaseri]PSM52050.1 beta-aspartyl-peptidase [Campylobacter blaseri]PSM53835.1 beta-aspartyl-peptidase [Campylobacter blaseri]QKF85613.1 isoaspartyl dipeptidase [Campylobacter blaseri]